MKKQCLVTLSLILTGLSFGAKITCPVLQCGEQDPDKPVKPDLCYKHDQQQPNRQVTVYDCQWYQFWGYSKLMGQEVACELDLLTDKYAWVDEMT